MYVDKVVNYIILYTIFIIVVIAYPHVMGSNEPDNRKNKYTPKSRRIITWKNVNRRLNKWKAYLDKEMSKVTQNWGNTRKIKKRLIYAKCHNKAAYMGKQSQLKKISKLMNVLF